MRGDVRHVVLATLCTMGLVVGAEARAQERKLPWSVELAAENPGFLLLKIDARTIPTNAVFREVRFDATFFQDVTRQVKLATETFTLPGNVRAKLRPGVVNGVFVGHKRAGALAIEGKEFRGSYAAEGGKTDETAQIVRLKGKRANAIEGDAVLVNEPPTP